MDRRHFLALPAVAAVPAADLVFDVARPGRPVRALHGVNGGPLASGGLLDLSARWKEVAFPLARLHDCHWPVPDVVDVSAIFADPKADPSRPESYDFERTDEYVKAVHACGSRIVYRLGESIEHQKAKRRVRPPRDVGRWATVCVGIVRHYLTVAKVPVAYWEIWNEPDNRPSCWTGTDEEFFRLYAVTSLALRKAFPDIKIGGPGLGNSGDLKGDLLTPTAFAREFLKRCRAEKLPLDFLSWHAYTDDPDEFVRRAKGMRKVLDEAGFAKCESHLNEWNYLPSNSWRGIKADAPEREKWYARVNGPEGAAFVASTLMRLQDAPIDAANYFTAECPGMGLFSPHGTPSEAFAAFKAFAGLVGRERLPLKGAPPRGLTAMAGLGADGVRVLLANAGAAATVTVRAAGTKAAPVRVEIPAHGVRLVAASKT